MKKSFLVSSLAVLCLALMVFQSCKKEKLYELDTLLANGVDLNAAASATGVAANANIVATFKEAIDAATATNTNITLTSDYDGANIPLTITVSENVVTIDPTEDLGTGSLYKLVFTAGVAFADGEANVTAFTVRLRQSANSLLQEPLLTGILKTMPKTR